MAYNVSWSAAAEAQLAEIWLASRSRDRVSESARRLEQALQQRPLDVGESREGVRRIAFDDLLACEFVVDESTMRVELIWLWLHHSGG